MPVRKTKGKKTGSDMTTTTTSGRQGDCVECSKSEITYDSLPFKQVAILDDYTVHHGPKSALNDDAPLTFEIAGSGEDYMDLSDLTLKLKV